MKKDFVQYFAFTFLLDISPKLLRLLSCWMLDRPQTVKYIRSTIYFQLCRYLFGSVLISDGLNSKTGKLVYIAIVGNQSKEQH